ncbi:MAG: acyl-CoA dehydratase activase [Acidobacteriota bacterium]
MDLYAGVDVGSLTAKAVILGEDGSRLGESLVRTSPDFAESARRALGEALSSAGSPGAEPRATVGTGYGRASVPGAARSVTEITCHARGAAELVEGVRLVVDVGGQDSKAIRVGPGGRVEDFAMNDKCAAGTGRFLSAMAETLHTGIEGLGPAGLRSRRDVVLSSTCTVFAESEVISLLAGGEKADDVAHAVHLAMARRLAGLVRLVGAQEPAAFTGGGALNGDLVRCLESVLGLAFTVPEKPQLAGALGAALIARESGPR